MGGGGLAGRRLSGTLQEWPVGSPFTASLQPGPARPPPGARTRAVTVQKRLVFMATPRLGLPPAHPHAAGPSRLTCRVPAHPPAQPLRTASFLTWPAPPTSAPSSTASGAVLPLATPAHPAGLSSNDATSPGAFLGCPSSRPAAPTFVSLCIAVLRHASQLSYSCDSLFDLPSLSPAPQTPP